MMEIFKSLAVLKALADKSRLMIINALMEKPYYVEELSVRLHLAPSTVSFHLKKMEKADLVQKTKEQYYIVYRLNEGLFEQSLKSLVGFQNLEKNVQEERLETYRHKVLNAFLKGDRLIQIPVQQKKRMVVLGVFTRLFKENKVYSEKEVNTLISGKYEDYCTLRRYLIDHGLMVRDKGNYRLTSEGADLAHHSQNRRSEMNQGKSEIRHKKALKMAYKHAPKIGGIFQIKNKVSGRVLLGSSLNLNGPLNRHKIELMTGVHKNRELLEDWRRSGEKAFLFEVLETVEQGSDSLSRFSERLSDVERKWLEKTQPLKGLLYNTSDKIRQV